MSKKQKFAYSIEPKGGRLKHVVEIQMGSQYVTKPVLFITAFGRKQIDPAWLAKAMNATVNMDDPEQWVAVAKTHMDASEAQAQQNTRLKSERDELLAALKEIKKFVDNDFPPKVAIGKRSVEYTDAWQRMNDLILKLEGGKP